MKLLLIGLLKLPRKMSPTPWAMKHPYLGQNILLRESENHKVLYRMRCLNSPQYALRLHLNQLKTLLMCSVKNRIKRNIAKAIQIEK